MTQSFDLTFDLKSALQRVKDIRKKIRRDIRALKKLGEKHPEGLTGAEEQGLHARLDAYAANLEHVAREGLKGPKKQFKMAKWRQLDTINACILGVLRAFVRRDKFISLTKIIHLAGELSVYAPLKEEVRALWAAKDKGGYRIIVIPGLMRAAQGFIVRDTLSVMAIDSPFDYAKKGGGGERGLVQQISADISDGIDWWWTPDVKSCFASIKPGHLKGVLPQHRQLLMNVVYLPKCAKVVVKKPSEREAKAIIESLNVSHPYLMMKSLYDLIKFTTQSVRLGLPTGSVTAPLAARAVLGRNIAVALLGEKAVARSFSDDLNFGASTKGYAVVVKLIVTKQFSSLPAGPIELHETPILSAYSRKVEVLGYRLEPGNGHGDNFVHAKPGPKRIKRFKSRLHQRLTDAGPDAKHFEVGEEYRQRWFAGQQAWTKVPELSDDTSANITVTYVDDFIHGMPLGTFYFNKPKIKYAGGDPPWT
jgi:hypothetical protein